MKVDFNKFFRFNIGDEVCHRSYSRGSYSWDNRFGFTGAHPTLITGRVLEIAGSGIQAFYSFRSLDAKSFNLSEFEMVHPRDAAKVAFALKQKGDAKSDEYRGDEILSLLPKVTRIESTPEEREAILRLAEFKLRPGDRVIAGTAGDHTIQGIVMSALVDECIGAVERFYNITFANVKLGIGFGKVHENLLTKSAFN